MIFNKNTHSSLAEPSSMPAKNNLIKTGLTALLFLSVLPSFGQQKGTAVNRVADPIIVKVAVVIEDPKIPSKGNKRMHEAFKTPGYKFEWHDPQKLMEDYRDSLNSLSGGAVRYAEAVRRAAQRRRAHPILVRARRRRVRRGLPARLRPRPRLRHRQDDGAGARVLAARRPPQSDDQDPGHGGPRVLGDESSAAQPDPVTGDRAGPRRSRQLPAGDPVSACRSNPRSMSTARCCATCRRRCRCSASAPRPSCRAPSSTC